MINNNIILSITEEIRKVLPSASVSLFGSRATGMFHDESDWDILILSKQPVDRKIKQSIHNVLFPFSVQLGAFINTLVVQEDDWLNNPVWYSLQQSIGAIPVAT